MVQGIIIDACMHNTHAVMAEDFHVFSLALLVTKNININTLVWKFFIASCSSMRYATQEKYVSRIIPIVDIDMF